VQKVLDKIDTSNEIGLRDRALLGTLPYTFARIGAVVNLKVEDYFQTGKRSMIRFREKGGKETEIPVHHKLEELLDQYLEKSGLRNRPDAPLFHAVGKTRKLGNRAATRIDAARMLKRRLKDAGLSDAFSPHSFRATGITNFLENAGGGPADCRSCRYSDDQTLRSTWAEGFTRRHGADSVLITRYGKLSGKIFISYRREESRSAIRLCDLLSEHFSRNQIFMGIDSIALDADYVKAIEKTVGECYVLVAVIGPHWLTSDGTLN
jgi:Phage integrase family